MSVEKALQLAKDHGAKYVDIMFGDMFGTLQHFTIVARRTLQGFANEGRHIFRANLKDLVFNRLRACRAEFVRRHVAAFVELIRLPHMFNASHR